MFPTNVSNWGGTIYNVWTGGWSHTGHTDNAGKIVCKDIKHERKCFLFTYIFLLASDTNKTTKNLFSF